MKVAGIDCGTNSIRLLIAQSSVQECPAQEQEAEGLSEAKLGGGRNSAASGRVKLLDIERQMKVVRLGQGVDKTGRFAEEALERTFAAVDEYAELCRKYEVESIRFAATSAARDASNREVFLRGIAQRLGVEAQILSGEEEARTSFSGAISALPPATAMPVIAVDLGGGSTELALGDKDGHILGAFSMDVGCVRMHERHLVSDIPTSEEISRARADIRRMLDLAEEKVDLGAARGLVGLAGTITTLTAKYLKLNAYDSQKIHGTVMSVDETLEVCDWFIHSSREDRANLGFMHPGRIDVIASGALVWAEVVSRVDQRMREAGNELEGIVTSEHDILDGLAMWAAQEVQAPFAEKF